MTTTRQYVLNPTATELSSTQLNLVVAGTQQAVLMVESEANELPEDVMLGAVVYGHQQMQAVIDVINELADEAGKPLWDWAAPAKDEALISRLVEMAEADLRAAYQDWNELRASAGGRCVRSALNQRSRKFGIRSKWTRPLM